MPEPYEKLECIGRGSFGEVFKGIEKSTGRTVALKLVDLEKADDEIDIIQREIKVMSEISNPYVVQYHTSLMKGSTLWIVMEYMSGGSLKNLLDTVGPFPEDAIAAIMKGLFSGLHYIHKERKLHRDIKAANILISNKGEVKLGDFGVAGQMTASVRQRNTFVGSPLWMAPEVIKESLYDEKTDIWSAGITVIELSKGLPPYATEHPYQVLFKIPENDPPRLDGDQFSKGLKDLVAACLQRIPADRPSAEQLLTLPFLKKARPGAIRELLKKKPSGEQTHMNGNGDVESIMGNSFIGNADTIFRSDSLTVGTGRGQDVSSGDSGGQGTTIGRSLNGVGSRFAEGNGGDDGYGSGVLARWDFDSVEDRDKKKIESMDLGTISKIPDDLHIHIVDDDNVTSKISMMTNKEVEEREKGRSKSMPMTSTTSIVEKYDVEEEVKEEVDDDDYGTVVRRRAGSLDLGTPRSNGSGGGRRNGRPRGSGGQNVNVNRKKSSYNEEEEKNSSEVLTQLILPVISQMRADVDASGDRNMELIDSLGSLEVFFVECENAKKGSSLNLMEALIKSANNSSSNVVKNMIKRCLRSTNPHDGG